MKQSTKILLAAAVFLVGLMATGMFLLRRDIQALHEKEKAESGFVAVPTEPFTNIHISDNLKLRISEGGKLRLEVQENSGLQLHTRNDTLFLSAGTSTDTATGKDFQARIMMPELKALKGAPGSKIHLENFHSDSLLVELNGGIFTGNRNDIGHTTYKTSGEARVEVSEKIW